MNRKQVYNGLLKFIKPESDCNISNSSSKSLSIASSKQVFFQLKKNHTRKISNFADLNQNIQLKNKNNSFSLILDDHKQPKIVENINNFIQSTVCEHQLDDDVKTNSTKSYDTHQDNINKVNTNQLKLISYQSAHFDHKNNQFIGQGDIEQFGKNNQIEKEQIQVFKSRNSHQHHQKLIINQPQNYEIIKKNNQNEYALAFRTNIRRKSTSLKISQFLLSSQPIGQGTYSKVYRAIHKKTGMVCALKILQKKKIQQLKLVKNLIEQIKIMMLCEHQNVSKIWGFFEQGHYFYIVMEYCTDGELYKLIKNFDQQQKTSFQSYKKKLNYLRQLCQAVEFLHEKNIMHRDIKPQNILLTIDNNAKLTDFGWARIIKNQSQELRKTFCGTPLYLAPQQIQHHQYNKSIDLWAIGILSFELLTGKIPFTIQSFDDLNKIVNQDINYKEIQVFPYAKQFISILLQKNGSKRLQATKLSEHKIFDILDEFDEDSFMYELQFGKLI